MYYNGKDTNDKDNKVVNLADKLKQKKENKSMDTDMSLHSALKLAVQEVDTLTDVEGSNGVLAITFNSEQEPQLILAGQIDPFKTVGFLTFVQQELLSTTSLLAPPDDDFEDYS